jgi:hypothetical protein
VFTLHPAGNGFRFKAQQAPISDQTLRRSPLTQSPIAVQKRLLITPVAKQVVGLRIHEETALRELLKRVAESL